MSNPLAKLKQETVEQEDDVDDEMENGYELPIDDGK